MRAFVFATALATLIAMPSGSFAEPASDAPNWTQTTWQDGAAFAIATARWRAVVSIERARLVAFGPAADTSTNVIFSPKTMDAAIGWGGHRVWLGPQVDWRAIWPPDPAWEASAPSAIRVEGSRLELQMPKSSDGWPRVTRVYEVDDGKLACRIEVGAEGRRHYQIIQIIQTPPPDDLTVPPTPTKAFPEGLVLLPPIDDRRKPLRADPLPPQVKVTTAGIHLSQTAKSEKVGFLPSKLVAIYGDYALEVSPGTTTGTEVGQPDDGYYTQVYIGPTAIHVIELEQLSPLLKMGEAGSSTITLDLVKR